MRRMAGQSFAITTSSFNGEEDIAHMVFQDKAATLHWLDTIVDYIHEMRRWIQEGDRETLAALLTELDMQREQWLGERRQNDWQESGPPKIDHPGVMQQLFGSFGTRRVGRDDES